ncbi:MAG: hypothetical protein AAF518_27010 [Spirochaetota bacterium]
MKQEYEKSFFIPLARTQELAEKAYLGLRESVKADPNSPRIYSIVYSQIRSDTNEIQVFTATVGEKMDSYYRQAGPVFAIFASSAGYIICTLNRGVQGGEPILTGKEPKQIVLFKD